MYISLSVKAAVAEYHRPGSFQTTGVYFIILEAGKSEINVPADSVSGETETDSQFFLLCPHLVEGQMSSQGSLW